MKNYRVGFKKGGNVTDVSVGPWKEKQKPKPGPKPGPGKREKLKKGRDFMEDPYRRKGREGREAPKVKPDPYRRGWGKPPQLKKSQKERREELRKKARKSGSTVVFHDEWDKIDPGLQKGLFKKDGGRAGLKKGGPKPGTYDYFLLHKREKKKEGGAIRVGKAFGGPSHSVRRAVKKILKKAKAKKDTESVRDVRARGGAIRKIAKKIKAKKDTESVRDVRAGGGAIRKIAKKIKAKKDTESVKDVR